MYAKLAHDLLRAGIFDHQVEIPASDHFASDAGSLLASASGCTSRPAANP
jgi:hypothetical protein